jgi:hypothetical protein
MPGSEKGKLTLKLALIAILLFGRSRLLHIGKRLERKINSGGKMFKKIVTHILSWNGHQNVIIDELKHYLNNVLTPEEKSKAVLSVNEKLFNYLCVMKQIKLTSIYLSESEDPISGSLFSGCFIEENNDIPDKCISIVCSDFPKD